MQDKCNHRFPPNIGELEDRDRFYVYDASSGTKRMCLAKTVAEYISLQNDIHVKEGVFDANTAVLTLTLTDESTVTIQGFKAFQLGQLAWPDYDPANPAISVKNQIYVYQPKNPDGTYSGPAIEVYDPVGGNVMGESPDENLKTNPSIEEISTREGAGRETVFTTGFESTGKGSGEFTYDPTSTASEVKGVIIKPPSINTGRWKRSNSEDLTVYHFGADGGGSVDDTQALRDWINWQSSTGKQNPYIGAGDFLVTGFLPFPNRSSIVGAGHDTNIIVGFSDESNVLFRVPDSTYAYSWIMEKLRFTVASGGSQRAQVMNVFGSLRGGVIRDVSCWEFSRPIELDGNIWGNVTIDSLNLYRVQNPIIDGDVALKFHGNTMQGQNIEIIGAFDTLVDFEGRVFKLDGMNPSGSQDPYPANQGIVLRNAKAGYIRSAWIEHTDAGGQLNGEAKSIIAYDCESISVENCNIPTGSVWFSGGRRNSVRSIEYAQANGGLKLTNGAQVNIEKSGLGARNVSTVSSEVSYAQPALIDGNNSGKGKLSNPTYPAGNPELLKTNNALVTYQDNSSVGNFVSGTKSTSVVTTGGSQGARLVFSAPVNEVYTVCAYVKNLTTDEIIIRQSPSTDTVVITDKTIYNRTTKGRSANQWTLLTIAVSSPTGNISVDIINSVAGTFLIDSIDVYKDASTFNPSLNG